MKLLSKEAFESAKRYLENHGRKLDLAWYRLVFEDGTFDILASKFRISYQIDCLFTGRLRIIK